MEKVKKTACERQCALHGETVKWVLTKVAESARCLYATLFTMHTYKIYRATRGCCDDDAGAIENQEQEDTVYGTTLKTKPLPRQRLLHAVA